ncbi:MAG: hypothetical protein KGI50_04770 [Patescibacteria group bacterium]|nr:hypothetical protein [Patescibacteria group bacterium]MDE2438649.1 hypothetical protein [Patescibacteria group bacterium]
MTIKSSSTARKLVIPLPVSSMGTVTTRSLRWCKELHAALNPLLQYKLQDGSAAVGWYVFAGHNDLVALGGTSFEETLERPLIWNCVPKEHRNRVVCKIVLFSEACICEREEWFILEDFFADAAGAREKFARVIAHLEQHAVPPVAPQNIVRALAALKRNEK